MTCTFCRSRLGTTYTPIDSWYMREFIDAFRIQLDNHRVCYVCHHWMGQQLQLLDDVLYLTAKYKKE